MEELTKAEERIMQIFWKIKKGFVKDVISQLPDGDKTPYNTVSSVVRILVSKGYLSYKAYGKTYKYFPKISKPEYRKIHFKKMISGYFSDSPASLLSYMVKEEDLSQKEINRLRDIINKIK